MIVDIG